MNFANLEIQEKTFTREGHPRGQDFEGIKFRRYISKAQNLKKGSKTKEVFTISDKLFEKLNLEQYALAQANIPNGGGVLLLVVEDQEEKKPAAKFLRKSSHKDKATGNIVQEKKTGSFSNDMLVAALTKAGLLGTEAELKAFYTVEDLTNSPEWADKPAHVNAILKIVKDNSVVVEEDDSDAVQDTAKAKPSMAVAGQDDF